MVYLIVRVIERKIRRMKMKVLIKKKRLEEYLLVKLTANEVIKEVMKCVNQGLYTRAIKTVTAKGITLKVVNEADLSLIAASLIITENQAHFDLMVD